MKSRKDDDTKNISQLPENGNLWIFISANKTENVTQSLKWRVLVFIVLSLKLTLKKNVNIVS